MMTETTTTKKELYAAFLEADALFKAACLACENASAKEQDAIGRGEIHRAPTYARRREAHYAMTKALNASVAACA